jgi:non-heme chloroperoxidase
VQSRWVEGSGGVRLHVLDAGNPDGMPLVFVHGWSQSYLSWIEQWTDPVLADEFRIIAVDLRGHGKSEAPADADAYRDGGIWAEDLHNVIESLGLVAPVLVGWSYGGFVVGDYLRRYSDSAISGVNFVDWAIIMGEAGGRAGLIGNGFFDFYPGSISDDLLENIEAMRAFVRACAAIELTPAQVETMLAYNMAVTPFVRWAMTTRPDSDNTPELEALRVPVLSTQGSLDNVALPASADYIAAHVKTCTVSVFEGAGHSPFLEFPQRYNRELRDFARSLKG